MKAIKNFKILCVWSRQRPLVGILCCPTGQKAQVTPIEKEITMALEITTVDSFPQITRSGRTSAELQQIIDSLIESNKSGKTYMIANVEEGKKFNSLQQRIRAQAKKLDIRVMIHFDKSTNSLYYKCASNNESVSQMKADVKAKDVKSVKTNAKTNA